MKFFIYLIISLIVIEISQGEEEVTDHWYSPCENTTGPSSIEDCTGKSTEFVDETCCFMEATQDGIQDKECVEVTRDDIRTKELIDKTVEMIKNGEYWDYYNETYESVISFRCSSNYILPKIFLVILNTILYFL